MMGTKTTRALFWRTLSVEIRSLFGGIGFREQVQGAFCRTREIFLDGLGFVPDASFTRIHVPVGISVPAIEDKIRYLNGGQRCALLVSRWLGQFKRGFRQSDIYYHFATVEELKPTLQRVYIDFMEQAQPWLANLTTMDDAAAEFYKWRVAPSSTGEPRPPDPFAWAIYAWLIREAGRPNDARMWLERAHEFLKVPLHMKRGQSVPDGTPGSQPVAHKPEYDRLAELLAKDLQAEY